MVFDDARSKRVVLVAHCVLNQNAKLDRCAHYPGAIREAAQLLIDAGVGLLQMPCPELLCLGLDREVEQGANPSVESEDTRIALRMAEGDARAMCQEMVDGLVVQIEEYHKNGFDILGVVGINGSPTCGVESTWADNREKEGPGLFIHLLQASLAARGTSLEMRGIKAYEPKEAVRTLRDLLKH
jgi:predicted secreted protein